MVDREAKDPSPGDRPAGALADWEDEVGFSRWASAEDPDRQASSARPSSALKALLDRVVRALEAGKDPPDRVAPPVAAREVENPFA